MSDDDRLPASSASPSSLAMMLRSAPTVSEGGGTLAIRRRWTPSGPGGWVFFPLLLAGGLVLAVGGGVLAWRDGALAVGIPIAATSIFATYLLAAAWANSTRVVMYQGWLLRSRGPFPWPGRRRDVPARDLRGISRHVRYLRQPSGAVWGVDVTLVAELRDGRKVELVGGLDEKQALQVERFIESTLGISDR